MSRVNKMILLLFFIFAALGSFLLMAFLPALMTRSLTQSHVDFDLVYEPGDYGLSPIEVALKTKDGLSLVAWEVTVSNPRAVLVFLGDMHEPSVTAFWGHARALQEHGYASLLLEMRAHGASEGEQIGLGYDEHLDVLAALHYLQATGRYDHKPIIPYGLGMGAATAINAVGLYPELAGAISIAAYSSWPDLFRDNLYFSGMPFLLAVLEKPFVNLYTLFRFGWARRNFTPQKQMARLGPRPALLMHSQGDEQVPYLNLERLLASAPGHVEVFVREGAQHYFTTDFLHPEQDREYMERVLGFLARNFN